MPKISVLFHVGAANKKALPLTTNLTPLVTALLVYLQIFPYNCSNSFSPMPVSL